MEKLFNLEKILRWFTFLYLPPYIPGAVWKLSECLNSVQETFSPGCKRSPADFVSFVFCYSSSQRQRVNSDSSAAEALTHNSTPVVSKLSRLVYPHKNKMQPKCITNQ